MTLIGDAAHPMLPFLAQGAGMAIEDAAVLADMLGKYLDDPADALRAYEGARWHRTARAQQASRRQGRIYGLSGPEALIRNLAMRAMGGEKLLSRYDWLYSWQPPERFCEPERAMFYVSLDHRRQPAETVLARRAQQTVAAMAACRAPISHKAKLDATLLAIKLQEDAGIDIVCDGEMSRQHFVHGFLEFVDGIDFAHKVEMGIRADRYKAMVPVVRGALTLKGRVHQAEARHARAHTKRKLKITLPGPMTISDTIADAHYGDKVKMAMAFAGSAQPGSARAARGRRRRHPVRRAGVQRVHGRGARLGHRGAASRDRRAYLHHRRAHLLRLRHQGQYRLEEFARRRVAAIREDFSGAGQKPHQAGVARMPSIRACR